MESVKSRLRRMECQAGAPSWLQLDKKFEQGSFIAFPQIGASFKFYFDRIGKGYWMTSPVTKIIWKGYSLSFKTKNSTYELRPGWK